jgi:hypothetical protein
MNANPSQHHVDHCKTTGKVKKKPEKVCSGLFRVALPRRGLQVKSPIKYEKLNRELECPRTAIVFIVVRVLYGVRKRQAMYILHKFARSALAGTLLIVMAYCHRG